MTVCNYEQLLLHLGHNIVIAKYNDECLCVECEDCNEVLYEEYKKLLENYIRISYPYKNLEDIPDSTKGDCPDCSAGLLSIDLDMSFIATIYDTEFSFDVVICDQCNFIRMDRK